MAASDRRCDVSPFCGPVQPRIAALGLPIDLPWRWVHLGPIGPRTIPLVEHRGACWQHARTVSSAGPIGRFGGYHIDLLGVPTEPTGTGARYNALTGLWFVCGVAWRHPDDARAEWVATPDGRGDFGMPLGTDGLRPDFWAIARRCADLLSGRLTRVGHPLAEPADVWRNYEIAMQAEAMKARDPQLPWRIIAGRLGVSERALRNYRAAAARWHLSRDTRRMA